MNPEHGGLHRVEQLMGTAISLSLADPLPAAELTDLADQVFDWFREVDARFSTYKETSEVSRFGRGELSLAECSADLREVLASCADLWRDTDGYFDVQATGRLDPSGYVKGWSVQVASDRLVAAGAPNHCVNAGGDVRVRGNPLPGKPWRVGVRHPARPDQLCWVLAGTDLAVATSGTYERGYHVINPRTGTPARALRSVTVVGPDLGRADALATAALAMGLPGLPWLAGLSGYHAGAVTDDGLTFRSPGLPVVTGEPEPTG